MQGFKEFLIMVGGAILFAILVITLYTYCL